MTSVVDTLTGAIDLSGPNDGEGREAILDLAMLVKTVAVKDNVVIGLSISGKFVFEAVTRFPDKLVWVNWFPWINLTSANSYRFWMNASSLKQLGDFFRTLPRIDFDVASKAVRA